MKEYKFYGWQTADVPAVAEEYKKIENPRHLYDLLSDIWCADTCAPRMRDGWTKENMTLGQCSITAFLAQDIFGGEVYGILRSGGNYHCYNVIGDCVFDLTSEQFGDEVLSYENNPVQSREVHFAKEEKRLRYEYLKEELKMVRPIMRDPLFLAGKSEPATEAGKQVVQDLLDTLKANQDRCVGMAANMIGVKKNIIVVAAGPFMFAMIDAKITKRKGTFKTEEGCLSLDGVRPCTRYKEIEVDYLDQNFKPQHGKYTDWTAQIIQHELDHVDGIVI